MYNEIINNLKIQLSESEYNKIISGNVHLGVFAEPWLDYMLDGRKTIESRFRKNRSAPYNKIFKGDIVIVKKSGGNVVAYFTVKDALFFDLKSTPIEEIKLKYNSALCVGEDFWTSKKDSNFATLIFIDDLVMLPQPFHINKKGMQTWIKFEHN